MTIALIIAIILGGSLSVAAENATPGDTLYTVKTNINENVRSLFEASDSEQAKWDVRMAERRLEEAEKLEAEGKLNAETKAEINANIKSHLENAKRRIEKVQDEDPTLATELNNLMGVKLGAYGNTLIKLSSTSSASTSIDSDLNNPDTMSAAEGRLTAALNKIEEAKKFVAEKGTSVSAEARANAQLKIKAAEDTVVEGRARFAADAYAEAFDLFTEAHNLAQEAKIAVGASTEVELKPGNSATSSIRGGVQVDLGI
jgi:hypothetical protein